MSGVSSEQWNTPYCKNHITEDQGIWLRENCQPQSLLLQLTIVLLWIDLDRLTRNRWVNWTARVILETERVFHQWY